MPERGVYCRGLLHVGFTSRCCFIRSNLKCRFPETKGRTLEEIGILFGDEHVASQWYGLSEADKQKIRKEAMAIGTDDKKDHAVRTENIEV